MMARLNGWSLTELPRLNRSILAKELPPDALVETLASTVLTDLPAPESFSPRRARQLLVHLGFIGASVARQYQQSDPARKAAPERAFDPLLVGVQRIPFRSYFARVADRTGTGHCHRDSFASVVRWNVPTTEACWGGERIAVLPGAFDDGQVHTYTGDLGERLFFELIKKTETLERAVNGLLLPLSDGMVGLQSPDAVRRTRTAATLLTAVRQLSAEFGSARVGLAPEHFLDVFRQFAAHWEVGDIPPSGALDPESLERDLLLGLDIPGRDQHVLRLFPGLLESEQSDLRRLMGRPTLPDALLHSLGLDPGRLAGMSAAELRATVRRHPALAAWYQLLNAHAQASGMHLALTKKFMFRPARERDMAGIPDNSVVSRTRGTTGMDESLLERLVRARHNHVLSGLQHIPRLEMLALADLPDSAPMARAGLDLDALVRFADPATRRESQRRRADPHKRADPRRPADLRRLADLGRRAGVRGGGMTAAG